MQRISKDATEIARVAGNDRHLPREPLPCSAETIISKKGVTGTGKRRIDSPEPGKQIRV
jgi:hypothetical protein